MDQDITVPYGAPASLPPASAGTLGETLHLNAWHAGERIAVADGTRTVTHRELYLRGHRLAAGWAASGLTRDDRVAILAANRVEMCELYAASEISGIAVVPLNTRLSADEQRAVLRDAAPRALFFEAAHAEIAGRIADAAACAGRLVCLDEPSPPWAIPFERFVQDAPPTRAWPPFGPDALACLLYTSGTTGRPKGCMHSHRGLRAVAALMTAKMGLTASDRGLVVMPLFHMGGRSVSLGLHWTGGELFLQARFDVALMLDTIERQRITVTHLAPTMIQALLDHPDAATRDLSSLRVIFYSAAAMPQSLLARALERFGPVLVQSYGQTEVTGTVLPARCHVLGGDARDRRRLASVGFAPRGVEVAIVGDDDVPVPAGVAGPIRLRSPAAMTGYWNDPAATRDTLRDGWVCTGDIGVLDEDGFLTLVDRAKDVIITGGENVYSREVENALYAHPEVVEAAVIGVPDPRWGEAVCAVVVLAASSRLDASALIAHCRDRIAHYKAPRHVVFETSLPKLATGKIDKKALRRARHPTDP